MVGQDGGLMKPVMRKRSKVQGEVWEWFIIQLPQGEEAEDLPIGEDCIIYFVTLISLSFHCCSLVWSGKKETCKT